MKIALITLHWANNYGASLQVFATVKALEKYGEVSVLDYRNSYTSKGMTWIRLGTRPRDILRIGKDLFRLRPRYKVIKKFKAFSYRYLNLTPTLHNEKAFTEVAQTFDLFVSGSDQIWNPKIVNEEGRLDTHYFLKFAIGKKKISYASSLGTYQYDDEERAQVITLLKEYTHLSVREHDSAQYLSKLLHRDVTHVLDPTLLHNKKEWLQFFDLPDSKDGETYILVYALKKDLLLKQTVEKVQKRLGMRVITIDQDPFTNFKNDRHIKDAGPDEFVKLFSQADFVITNSFHGSCFSVNFNIPFIVTTPPTSINRIESLLSAVGVQNRIIKDVEDLSKSFEDHIDFDIINQKLQHLRETSNRYLANAVKREQ